MTTDACAQLPPVSAEYTPAGTWETIAGLKTYIATTPTPSTKRVIILIYDIFGPAPQTLQGADRLATLTSSVVLVPDFFEGEYAQATWFPTNTPEKEAAWNHFLKNRADVDAVVGQAKEVRKEVGERWPGVEGREGGVGVFGLCFGGKVAVLLTGEDNHGTGRYFSVSGMAHPSRLDARDAEALTVPHICLASPGEPAAVVAQYMEILNRPGVVGHVETYDKMFHGWMGARANLRDEVNLAEYERGYNDVGAFFDKHL